MTIYKEGGGEIKYTLHNIIATQGCRRNYQLPCLLGRPVLNNIITDNQNEKQCPNWLFGLEMQIKSTDIWRHM